MIVVIRGHQKDELIINKTLMDLL